MPNPVPAVAEPAPAVENPPQQPQPSRRAALTLNHNRRLQEADEQVFEVLHFADGTRASIREINQEYRRRTEIGSPSAGGGGSSGGAQGGDVDVSVTAAALNARQDSLRLLLGETPAKEFDVEERSAVRRLRGKYRFEWGRQLRE